MITYVDEKTYEMRGLSSDTKPTDGIGNGSIFFEIDTKKVYMLKRTDASTAEWVVIS